MKRHASVLIASAMLLAVPAHAQDTDTMTAPPPAIDAQPGSPAAPSTTMGSGTVLAPEGFTAVPDATTVAPEQISGVTLNGPEGDAIGSVAEVELGPDGQPSGLIADVGGFLGFGQHRVLLTFDQVRVFSNAEGTLVAVSDLNADQLKAMPEYVSPRA